MTIKPENVNTSPKRVDKMEEIIGREGIWLHPKEISSVAKALRDAGWIHRDALLTDEAVERACVGFEAEYMRAAKPDDEDFGLAWPDRTDAYRAGTRALIRKSIQAAIGETPKADPRTDGDYCEHEAPLNEMDCCPVCDAQFLPEEPRT